VTNKTLKKLGKNLKSVLFEIIENNESIKKRFRNSKQLGGIEAAQLPYYSGRKSISGDNFIIMGDAAELIDPFTGEGIGNALGSGIFAAEQAISCFQNKNFSAASLSTYDDRVYHKLGRELELGFKLHKRANSTYLLNLIINKAEKNPEFQKFVSNVIYDLDDQKKLSNIFYLFRLFFQKT